MSKLSNLHISDPINDSASKHHSHFENFILSKMEEKAIEIQKIRNLFINIDTMEKLQMTRNKIIQNFFSLEDDIRESYQLVKSTLIQNKDLAEQVEYLQNRSRELESKLNYLEKNSIEKEKTFHGLNKMVEMMTDKTRGDEEYIRDLEKRLLNYELKNQNNSQVITPIKNSSQIMKIQDSLEFPEKESNNKMPSLNYKYSNTETLTNDNAENLENVENAENVDSNINNTYNYSELLSERENHKKMINDYVNDQLNNLTNYNNFNSHSNYNNFNSSKNFTSQTSNEQSIHEIVKIRDKNKSQNEHNEHALEYTPTRKHETHQNTFHQNENQNTLQNSIKSQSHKVTYSNQVHNTHSSNINTNSNLDNLQNEKREIMNNPNNLIQSQSHNQNYQPLSPPIELNTISPNSNSNTAKLKANRVTDIIMKLNSNPDINSIVLKIFGERLLDQLMSAQVEEDLLERVEETIIEIEKLSENDIDEEEIMCDNQIQDFEHQEEGQYENQYEGQDQQEEEIIPNNNNPSESLKNLISFSNTSNTDNTANNYNIQKFTPYTASNTPNAANIKASPINNYKPDSNLNTNNKNIFHTPITNPNPTTNYTNLNLNNSFTGKERPISDILSANNLLNSRASNKSNISAKNIASNNYNLNLPVYKKSSTMSAMSEMTGMTPVSSMSAMNALNTMNTINNINACYNYLTGNTGNNFNTISTAKKIDEPNFESSLRRYTGPSSRNESKIFKNYTRVKGDFFDPSLQRGGRSRVSDGKSRSKSKTRSGNYTNYSGVGNPHIPAMNSYNNYVNTKLASPAKSYSNVSNASSNNYGYAGVGMGVGLNPNYNFQFSD
jgi:hypothetical protein